MNTTTGRHESLILRIASSIVLVECMIVSGEATGHCRHKEIEMANYGGVKGISSAYILQWDLFLGPISRLADSHIPNSTSIALWWVRHCDNATFGN